MLEILLSIGIIGGIIFLFSGIIFLSRRDDYRSHDNRGRKSGGSGNISVSECGDGGCGGGGGD